MVSPSAAARNGKLADDAGDLALAQRIAKVAPIGDAAARPMGPTGSGAGQVATAHWNPPRTTQWGLVTLGWVKVIPTRSSPAAWR